MNIRRAVYANLNRAAIIKLKGGALTGSPGTHFITPGTAGFSEAGGDAGPKVPWNENVNGSLSTAETYMKKAGYPSGKYTGNQTALIVGSNNGQDELADQPAHREGLQLAGDQDPPGPGRPVGHV